MTLNVHFAVFPDVSIPLYCNNTDSPNDQYSPDSRVGFSIRATFTLSVKTGSFHVIRACTVVNVCTMSCGQPVTTGGVLSENENNPIHRNFHPQRKKTSSLNKLNIFNSGPLFIVCRKFALPQFFSLTGGPVFIQTQMVLNTFCYRLILTENSCINVAYNS